MTAVELTIREGAGVITIDNPPVNALRAGMAEDIHACLAAAEDDPAIRAVVLIGAGRTFIAGADIRAFEKPESLLGILPLLGRLESCPKPVVAAIHGTALGGGLEVAMACHYRVASADAQVGQAEINLGLIPGAEGTQRLPRLAGVARALEMCVSGAPLPAAEALAAGILDEIVAGDLLSGAVRYALEKASAGGPWPKASSRDERLGTPEENEPLFANAREQAARTRRHQTAPHRAIEAVRAATTLPYREGCRRERVLFEECLAGPQSQAMIHAFLAERAATKVPAIYGAQPWPVDSVAIVGAGTMGGGIAMAFANAGIPVRLKDSTSAALDRGMSTVRKNYQNSVRKGRFTAEVMESRLALIQPQLTYDGFDSVGLIIEAVFENLALKKQIFAELDALAAPACLLATNSSTLDIDAMAAATSRPHMVAGMHFFSPANVMRLLEIVRGRDTAPEVLATAQAVARKLKKVGVVVGNCPGFVGNRMFALYLREAQFLVEEGATPWQVDQVLHDWGMAMGIFAVDDMAGIDVAWRVKQEQKHLETPGTRTPLVLDQLYAMGRLGQKTGLGWHRYDENRKASPDPEIEALIERTARAAGIERRTIGPEEIIERCIYAMVNEGARILQEGRASRAGDIDIIYLTGYGFPTYRGGPMWYADSVGLPAVHQRITEFQARHGALWTPAPLLAHLASKGGTFAALDRMPRPE